MNAIQITEDVIKSVLIMRVAMYVVVMLDIISEVMDSLVMVIRYIS